MPHLTGFINTTNNFDFEYNQTRTWYQIDGNLWLQFIAKGALGNQSSAAGRFPVSSQKLWYDFNFEKHVSNQLFV
jgi:hypothetical protein